jgi:hypothetical protein
VLSCRIAASSETGIYVLAAKDFGFDVADSLAANNANWRNDPARRVLREVWTVLLRQLREGQEGLGLTNEKAVQGTGLASFSLAGE